MNASKAANFTKFLQTLLKLNYSPTTPPTIYWTPSPPAFHKYHLFKLPLQQFYDNSFDPATSQVILRQPTRHPCNPRSTNFYEKNPKLPKNVPTA